MRICVRVRVCVRKGGMPVVLAPVEGTGIGQSLKQLLVLGVPPAEPAHLRLAAAGQNSTGLLVSPDHRRQTARAPEVGHIVEHLVGDAAGHKQLGRIRGAQLEVCVRCGDAPRALEIEAQAGDLVLEVALIPHRSLQAAAHRWQGLGGSRFEWRRYCGGAKLCRSVGQQRRAILAGQPILTAIGTGSTRADCVAGPGVEGERKERLQRLGHTDEQVDATLPVRALLCRLKRAPHRAGILAVDN